MPHVNQKLLARNGKFEFLGLELTRNGLGESFRKKSKIPSKKSKKPEKIEVKLPHVNKKPLARK